jgi:nucleotide-binding universal stress UspA family protein
MPAASVRRILVPLDLSLRSVPAASYAVSLAKRLEAELVFLHALRGLWPLDEMACDIRDRVLTLSDARFLFRRGSPAEVILEAAQTERTELIVLPSRPKPALTRLFDGSVAAQVLRRAQCPVWVGMTDPLRPIGERPIRHVACGLSLGPRAASVFRWSVQLARRFGAALSVIHASPALASNPGLPCDSEWRFWVAKMARDDIRELQTEAGAGPPEGGVWLEPGNPLEAIPPLANRLQADLLVLGKSPPRRFFGDLRTLSYEIACRTPCPVASV